MGRKTLNQNRQAPLIEVLDYDLLCAAGNNKDELRRALQNQRGGLSKNAYPHSHLKTWVGSVQAIDDFTWQSGEKKWQSRNNALAAMAFDNARLQQKIARLIRHYGANRLGVVIGSSTSSIDRTEDAYRALSEGVFSPEYRQPTVVNPHAPGLFAAHLCGITGPCITINTACSSSAKVFATAARWLRLGIVDAALVGGVDTLCLSVLHGFHALQLVSENPCRPFDQNRDGINLGEAAGFALLIRKNPKGPELDIESSGFCLSGFGESSDAHHMSHPHPEGLGARIAIQQALAQAQLNTHDIDYINLHGTSSRANDLIEGRLISELFPANTPVSSTKAWTGHTLGAAGITEAVVSLEAAKNNFVPGTLNLDQLDQQIPPLDMCPHNREKNLQRIMSNSFGFGGNNACLIFTKELTGDE